MTLPPPHALPVGTTVRLTLMPDDPDPVPPGSEGIVTGWDADGIWVAWRNGRRLKLLPDVDTWTVLG